MGLRKKTGLLFLAASGGGYFWLNRSGEFNRTLGKIRRDVTAVQERDPAATNIIETLTCYSGLHAILLHRMAHFLYEENLPVVPRIVSQLNRFLTGIEIHPAARIGEGFFIDHGAGGVLVQTSGVGEHWTCYVGWNLGVTAE